jgi:hypothetical protein
MLWLLGALITVPLFAMPLLAARASRPCWRAVMRWRPGCSFTGCSTGSAHASAGRRPAEHLLDQSYFIAALAREARFGRAPEALAEAGRRHHVPF